jgi:uncharacterized protein
VRRRSLPNLLVVLVSLYLLGTIVGGVALGWTALHPGRRPITPNEQIQAEETAKSDDAELRDVSIVAPDGAVLRAWHIRPKKANGSAVILLHGVGDDRLGISGYGDWLVRNHYSVLLPDSRALGLSEGELATYGLKESDDIHSWVSWLEENDRPRCVFGFGESMGAAQLLQSLPKEPRFCAVVAESPFETFREVAYARFGQPFHLGPWLGRTFFWPTVEVGFLSVRYRWGLDMDLASPDRAVVASSVPVFLIHGLSDRNIPPYHSDDLEAQNPSKVILWRVAGAAHCGAHGVSPEEFERRVLDWFSAHPPQQDFRTTRGTC